ncbi:helix-turn-helix domain-containing protein [Tenacibaculum finnmarkense genomovar finnmarkense]|uniref:helix-turn-helix domain-containing protein n=1 Tax=Tenacibaculum TaxID=104267 RepID=UPI000C6BCEBE|nr:MULTISPECIES: helix-turn-helix domain-containing protein [Tenacibaculum]MCD8405018.1 helix-turn-helix domain-containing protein [Tenacibaculum dicentrarchi]MBE7634119.1 helix-turn-helix domain-containing protein [Tenacibaculum finnmarkense genomovar ulcerans]MBE7649066.1 helix-turn-helix domain-containing protein [Tenacibaculum finnmarkense genomovar ulcerans]MBE7687437.1 helix-turn-helix domain-containing protein [Tenacibaculum finnmarkense genomovar ulcerans]MBE7697635.1 helix-turn-helix 
MLLSFNDLPTVLNEVLELQKELKNLILSQETSSQSETEIPLNIKEVAKLTQLSVPTIYHYVSERKIPHYKQGNKLRFFKSEIIDWIKSSKIKTVSEIEADANVLLSKKAV